MNTENIRVRVPLTVDPSKYRCARSHLGIRLHNRSIVDNGSSRLWRQMELFDKV
jgi:hypothetical protein